MEQTGYKAGWRPYLLVICTPVQYTAHMRAPLLLSVACLWMAFYSSASLSTSIYQWVDSSGVEHFSQSPPVHARYTRINPEVAPPTRAPGVASVEKFTQDNATQRAARNKTREAALRAKADRAEQCAKARQRISQLQAATAHRLFMKDANGQRRRMTQPEFEKLLGQAQTRADANCSD